MPLGFIDHDTHRLIITDAKNNVDATADANPDDPTATTSLMESMPIRDFYNSGQNIIEEDVPQFRASSSLTSSPEDDHITLRSTFSNPDISDVSEVLYKDGRRGMHQALEDDDDLISTLSQFVRYHEQKQASSSGQEEIEVPTILPQRRPSATSLTSSSAYLMSINWQMNQSKNNRPTGPILSTGLLERILSQLRLSLEHLVQNRDNEDMQNSIDEVQEDEGPDYASIHRKIEIVLRSLCIYSENDANISLLSLHNYQSQSSPIVQLVKLATVYINYLKSSLLSGNSSQSQSPTHAVSSSSSSSSSSSPPPSPSASSQNAIEKNKDKKTIKAQSTESSDTTARSFYCPKLEPISRNLDLVLQILESICSRSEMASDLCCKEHFIERLIDIIELPTTAQSTLNSFNIRLTLRLFKTLAAHKMNPYELKRVFRALRSINESLMLIPLLNTLSEICYRNNEIAFKRPSNCFYFGQLPSDGLFIQGLRWSQSTVSFTIHCVIKIDPLLFQYHHPSSPLAASLESDPLANEELPQLRHTVYTLNCGQKFFEAFLISPSGTLVIGSMLVTNGQFACYTVPNSEKFLVDNEWHSLTITYAPPIQTNRGSLPFNPLFGLVKSSSSTFHSQSEYQLVVHIDGVLRSSVAVPPAASSNSRLTPNSPSSYLQDHLMAVSCSFGAASNLPSQISSNGIENSSTNQVGFDTKRSNGLARPSYFSSASSPNTRDASPSTEYRHVSFTNRGDTRPSRSNSAGNGGSSWKTPPLIKPMGDFLIDNMFQKAVNPIKNLINTNIRHNSSNSRSMSPSLRSWRLCPCGAIDRMWGISVPLHGFIASIAVFNDALTFHQINFLHSNICNSSLFHESNLKRESSSSGPSGSSTTSAFESPAAKLLAYFDAKSYSKRAKMCPNLSPSSSSSSFSGAVKANIECSVYLEESDVKDVVNCIGGVNVVLPILEIISKMMDDPYHRITPPPPNQLSKNAKAGNGTSDYLSLKTSPSSHPDVIEDWVVLKPRRSLNNELIRNKHPVAAFFNLILKLIENNNSWIRDSCHLQFMEQMTSKSGLPIIGLLLQRLPNALVNVDLLLAVEQLVDELNQLVVSPHATQSVVMLTYRFIVFEFKLWSKGDFTTQIGHAQYILSLIKDERKFFRKEYGIQFIFDSIRQYYLEHTQNVLKSNYSDLKVVRGCYLRIIRYFFSKDVNHAEVSALINLLLLAASNEQYVPDTFISELMDLLIALLKNRHTKDQLYLLLYEPNQAQLLYSLLVKESFDCSMKVKVLKIIHLLLKTEKVYEKSKIKLRLHDIGFACFPLLLKTPTAWTSEIWNLLFDQSLLCAKMNTSISSLIFENDSLQCCFQDALVILHFICPLDLSLKINLASRFLKVVMLDVSRYPKFVASVTGWQEALVGLLIKKSITASHKPSLGSLRSAQMSYGRRHSMLPNVEGSMASRLLVRRFSHQMLPGSGGDSAMMETSLTPLGQQIANANSMQFISQESLASSSGGTASYSFRSRSGSLATTSPSTLASPDPDSFMEAFKLSSEGKQDMLLQIVTQTSFLALFHGIESSDKQAWLQRGQLFALIDMLAFNNEMLLPVVKIKQTLFKRCLQHFVDKLSKGSSSSDHDMENLFQIIRLIFDFVVLDPCNTIAEGQPFPVTEQMLDLIVNVMELCNVFSDEGWQEMAILCNGLLMSCVKCKDLTLVARASAKLHGLLQTRATIDVGELNYLLICLDESLVDSIDYDDENHYSFIVPVLRAVLEKLNVAIPNLRKLHGLPSLINGPEFFERFKTYCVASEWRSFIERAVKPVSDKYYREKIAPIAEQLNEFWSEAQESAIVSRHKRDREKGEAKLRFQSQILDATKQKIEQEKSRYNQLIAKQNTANLSSLRRWRLKKLQLYGALNGPWYRKGAFQLNAYWKHSCRENLLRMRPKLTLNSSFDQHRDASWMRDNVGVCPIKKPSLNPFDRVVPTLSRETSKEEEYAIEEEELLALLAENTLKDERLLEENATVDGKEKPINPADVVVLTENCELISMMSAIKGKLEISRRWVSFIQDEQESSSPKTLHHLEGADSKYDFRYSLAMIHEMYIRRYNMRRVAIEWFLLDRTSFFINFFKHSTVVKVFGRLLSLRPPNLLPLVREVGYKTPAEILKASGLTDRWVSCEISNYEYLMALNQISGRTFNDLSQYPVFPWILSDYTSDELDLSDESTFRDLSRPIGVVNPANEELVRSKYESFLDVTGGSVEKFHYGTHYSNSAGVVHFLARLEPYTSLHIEVHGNRFDVADRQFHSLQSTWKMLMDSPNDVKELIPEFFYLPDFLTNMNDFDFGRLQLSKESINDVILPNWASSPEDFIQKHRQALESDHVSQHLNEWIDLIWGHKQRGQAAVDALNVFYYVTYEDAIDLDSIQDPSERQAIEGMICNFGQTPSQLFKEPHPKRLKKHDLFAECIVDPLKSIRLSLTWSSLTVDFFRVSHKQQIIAMKIPPRLQSSSSYSSAKTLASSKLPSDAPWSDLITIGRDGSVSLNGWLPYDRNKQKPNSFTVEQVGFSECAADLNQLHPDVQLIPKLCAITHDRKYLLLAGFWDNTIRVYNIISSLSTSFSSSTSNNQQHQFHLQLSILAHSDLVTCIAVDPHMSTYLISGSKDTTCKIWDLVALGLMDASNNSSSSNSQVNKPLHSLYGHDASVSDVGLDLALDMAVTASINGILNIYTIKDGIYLHTLIVSECINRICFSSMGHVIVNHGLNNIDVFNCNGKHLASLRGIRSSVADEQDMLQSLKTSPSKRSVKPYSVESMVASDDYLVIGDSHGALQIYQLFNLQLINEIRLADALGITGMDQRAIVSLYAVPSHNCTHLLAGCRGGQKVAVLTANVYH